jgi:alpha-tubulin suppressor-like RCC1 family protein
LKSGQAYTTGVNYCGQLLNGTKKDDSLPSITPVSGIARGAAGSQFTYLLTPNGTVWGSGWFPGKTEMYDDSVAVQLPAPSNVSSIDAGMNWAAFVHTNGEVSWQGTYPPYGVDNFIQDSIPFKLNGVSGIKKVSTGDYYCLFLGIDGSLKAIGIIPTSTQLMGPVQGVTYSTLTTIFTDVADVVTKGDGSLILRTDGTLWALGYNRNGEFGDGTTNPAALPRQINF